MSEKLTIRQELTKLEKRFQKWVSGDLNDLDMSLLINRSNKKIQKSCYCEYNVCCRKHSKHSIPHKNCIMR